MFILKNITTATKKKLRKVIDLINCHRHAFSQICLYNPSFLVAQNRKKVNDLIRLWSVAFQFIVQLYFTILFFFYFNRFYVYEMKRNLYVILLLSIHIKSHTQSPFVCRNGPSVYFFVAFSIFFTTYNNICLLFQ